MNDNQIPEVAEAARKLAEESSKEVMWVCPITKSAFPVSDIEAIENHKQRLLKRIEQNALKAREDAWRRAQDSLNPKNFIKSFQSAAKETDTLDEFTKVLEDHMKLTIPEGPKRESFILRIEIGHILTKDKDVFLTLTFTDKVGASLQGSEWDNLLVFLTGHTKFGIDSGSLFNGGWIHQDEVQKEKTAFTLPRYMYVSGKGKFLKRLAHKALDLGNIYRARLDLLLNWRTCGGVTLSYDKDLLKELEQARKQRVEATRRLTKVTDQLRAEAVETILSMD